MHDAIDAFRSAVEASLGTAPDDITPGRFIRFSNTGKRGDTACWLQMFDDLRGGTFGDFRAGIRETWTVVSPDSMTSSERAALRAQIANAKAQREKAQREAWRKNGDRNLYIQRQAREVKAGDPVAQYLRNRLGFDGRLAPACLRLHPALPYVHEGAVIGEFPCMLAPLVQADGSLVAWHRTYLTPDGQKASVPGPTKKLTPASGLVNGSSIRLFEPKGETIGAAEGIETALAAFLCSGVATIATYSAGNLAAFRWPKAIRRLVVFADADEAGAKAAAALKTRANQAGLSASIMAPSTPGHDWADVWAERQSAEVSK